VSEREKKMPSHNDELCCAALYSLSNKRIIYIITEILLQPAAVPCNSLLARPGLAGLLSVWAKPGGRSYCYSGVWAVNTGICGGRSAGSRIKATG